MGGWSGEGDRNGGGGGDRDGGGDLSSLWSDKLVCTKEGKQVQLGEIAFKFDKKTTTNNTYIVPVF